MPTMPVNLAEKLSLFSTNIGRQRSSAAFNGHDIMVVKVKGRFVWHSHPDTDDFFLVLKGRLTIEMRDGSVVARTRASFSSCRAASNIARSPTKKPSCCSSSPRDAQHRRRRDRRREDRDLTVMLLIPCPYCEMERPELEFRYGGEAHVARPLDPSTVSDDDWAEFPFLPRQPERLTAERWRHVSGCGRFFNCVRDTVSDTILKTYRAGEPKPDLDALAAELSR